LNLYISDGTGKQYNDEYTTIFLTRPIMEITITQNSNNCCEIPFGILNLDEISPFIFIYVNIM